MSKYSAILEKCCKPDECILGKVETEILQLKYTKLKMLYIFIQKSKSAKLSYKQHDVYHDKHSIALFMSNQSVIQLRM